MNNVTAGQFRKPARRQPISWAILGIFGGAILIMLFAIRGFIDVVSSF